MPHRIVYPDNLPNFSSIAIVADPFMSLPQSAQQTVSPPQPDGMAAELTLVVPGESDPSGDDQKGGDTGTSGVAGHRG